MTKKFGDEIKKHFPIFSNTKQIYFDNGATTHKPQCVIDSVVDFYSKHNANVYRGVHEQSEIATEMYEQARQTIASFINAQDSSEVVFTSGTTAGINFIADAWGAQNIKAGDEIVITQVEHHANLLPWQRLAQRVGATLRFVTLNTENFTLQTDNIITQKTKLVAVTHESNVLGPVWNDNEKQLESFIEKAHSVGAKVLLDMAQSIPHKKVDVQKLQTDFAVFSSHKMCGPTGVGALYISKKLQSEVEPYQLGGSMVNEVTFEDYKIKEAPFKFEAGTPPIAQVIGFAQAIIFLNEHVNFDELQKHEAELCSLTIDALEKIDGIKILGNKSWMKQHGHLVSFDVEGIHAHDIAGFLGMNDIAVRSGHHCAQPLSQLLGVISSTRFSFYCYNSISEVEKAIQVLHEAITVLKG